MATTSISSSGYKVTQPNYPSLISKKCLGVSPRYCCMRTEDIAFLHEAFCEFDDISYLIQSRSVLYRSKTQGVDHIAKYIRNAFSSYYYSINYTVNGNPYGASNDSFMLIDGNGITADSAIYNTEQAMHDAYKTIYGISGNQYSLRDLFPDKATGTYMDSHPYDIGVMTELFEIIKKIHKMKFIFEPPLSTSNMRYTTVRTERYQKKIVARASGYGDYESYGGRIYVQEDVPESITDQYSGSGGFDVDKEYRVDSNREHGRVFNPDDGNWISQTSDLEIKYTSEIKKSNNAQISTLLFSLPRPLSGATFPSTAKAAIELEAYFSPTVAGVGSYYYRYMTMVQNAILTPSSEQDGEFCNLSITLNADTIFNKFASGMTYPQVPDPGYGTSVTWTKSTYSINRCRVRIRRIYLVLDPPAYNATFSDET